ncbi:NUDIX domain-containing protein [Paenibacillus hodogayensis]|uniref:NUDIX domain-containing protein n=1 Tax=Paenibacillus hodogayensis TaxID=279208 RepID=A0ABV5VT44_9BACL
MQQELFDIFDEHMNRIGTATRRDTHLNGYWHQTFHCWIVIPEAEGPALLFQKRHPDKDTHPGKYDITCAGHLLAGEAPEDGVRELEEELGLVVPFERLVPIGVLPVEMRYRDLIDREFYHTYLLACSQPLEQYRLQPDEVVGLVKVAAADVSRLFAGETGAVSGTGLETAADGRPIPVSRLLERSDFVPHGDAYYRHVLDALLSRYA